MFQEVSLREPGHWPFIQKLEEDDGDDGPIPLEEDDKDNDICPPASEQETTNDGKKITIVIEVTIH